MAAFATMAAAEIRAYTKREDKTWVNAHAERMIDGTIAVRVQRFMSPTNPGYGGWVSLTDDTQV